MSLGFYDLMDEATWRRIGQTGRYERLVARQSMANAIRLARMNGWPAGSIESLLVRYRALVGEHRRTTRWRIRQERRRVELRAGAMRAAAE